MCFLVCGVSSSCLSKPLKSEGWHAVVLPCIGATIAAHKSLLTVHCRLTQMCRCSGMLHACLTGFHSVALQELGVSILNDLHSQRQTITHARDTLHGADDNIATARRVLATMSRRLMTNKLIMGGVSQHATASTSLCTCFDRERRSDGFCVLTAPMCLAAGICLLLLVSQ